MGRIKGQVQDSFMRIHHLDTFLLFSYSPLSKRAGFSAIIPAGETPFFRKGMSL